MIATATLAVLVASCSPPTQGGDGGGGSGKVSTVRLVLPHAALFTIGLPFTVAQQKGIFKKWKISVKPTFTSGGGSNVQAVIGGNADIGVETGPSAVFSAVSHGAKLKIVGASSTGLDVVFFSKASSPYKSLKDLTGKKLGYSSEGSSSDLAVHLVNKKLKATGLKPVSGEAIGSPPAQLTAVQTGQIAAGFTSAPQFLDQIQEGKLRAVVESEKEFPEYRNVAIRVAFANADYVKSHPKQVRAFLHAWHEAWQWVFAHRDEAVALWKRDAKLKDSTDTLKLGFKYFTARSQRIAPLNGIQQDVEDAVTLGSIKKPLSKAQVDEIVDTRYAPTSSSG